MSSEWKDPAGFKNRPFKGIKKVLKKPVSDIGSSKLTEPVPQENLTEDGVFAEAMRQVIEIPEFRELSISQGKSVSNLSDRSSDDSAYLLDQVLHGHDGIDLPRTQEHIEWVSQGYSKEILQRLHQGHYAIQDSLDLHGAVLEEAESELDFFMKNALRRSYRCIKIICGRGLRSFNGPVLKGAVVKWLLYKYRKYITAFVSARQCDGGLGAIYVLFR
ncbi:MAG: Smr/MutS family protein [Nitrospira sp.]|nr:Smr/MutS family protein [bacterium]MBL7050398.1 Smr/MutS family protein [Nitrospira sp.]